MHSLTTFEMLNVFILKNELKNELLAESLLAYTIVCKANSGISKATKPLR